MAENWESGQFLRSRYIESIDGEDSAHSGFLPREFVDDSTATFFAERAPRNIESTEALVYGMYPLGTGSPEFLPQRPNLVPIATTQEGVDQLMNCPRDGPC